MAEQSGFFDAHLVDGEYDRVYLAEHFAKYFASFIGNGIFGGKSNELQVREKETASMGVRVLSGQAWIDGYWYENDDEHPLTIDVADGVLNRIDSIVVRWNNSERIIRLAVKKGIAATNPVAPIVQRDDDYHELKLADIYIKAGATSITQSNITDKRLNTNECGLVIGVVQQLDADEFGIQLETYIQEFITEHDTWKNATEADITQWVSNFKTAATAWYNQFKIDSNSAVDSFLSTNQTRVDKLISDGTTDIDSLIASKIQEFNDIIEELESLAQDNDLYELNRSVNTLKQNVVNINNSISALERLSLYDSDYPGCYYREVDGVTEWVNPPNIPGIEYRTTERWNGSPVYTQMLYLGALSNKLAMAVTIDVEYNKVFFVSGYAFDPENNMSYPFPIIINGLTPIAVISGIEGNGSESNIIININEDLSAFSGYINIKYIK